MKGKLFVLSGPSGVGKNTILNRVIAASDHVRYSVSATSRQSRPGEVDGSSYYFVTRERFEEMIAQDELLEYAEYVGNYYGTPLAPIREAMENGLDIVMDVEVIGAKKIKARVPEKSASSAPSGNAARRRAMTTSFSTTMWTTRSANCARSWSQKNVKQWSASIYSRRNFNAVSRYVYAAHPCEQPVSARQCRRAPRAAAIHRGGNDP